MAIGITKKLNIEVDVVENTITFDNPDELSHLEILGILEYTKMIVIEDHIRKGE
jgi:hypothetical protein